MERKPIPILSPKFGPLQGLRVLSTSSVIAGPFCPSLFAWFGAEVIHVENPGLGDTYRTLPPVITRGDKVVSAPWANEATNRLSMELDLRLNKKPASREVFYGLIKQSDFWVENLVWIEQRYGISDKEVLEVNPRIIIVHVSGYGHPEFGGEREKCFRASYDMIGQCFSGWPNLIGPKDAPPSRANPWTGDYCAAMTAFYGALMAYLQMLKDGKGQVVDVSQFEALTRNFCESYFCTYLNTGVTMSRSGNKSVGFQPYDIFKANDSWVAIGTLGWGYICDPTPGRHTVSFEMVSVASGVPYAPYSEVNFPKPDIFDYEANAPIYATLSDLHYLLISTGLCDFVIWGVDTFPLVEFISSATGWDFTIAEGLKAGRRIQTLRQAFNIREGINTSEWRLPERIEAVLTAGPTAGRKFDWRTVKEKGYAALGWDATTGKPLDSTLEELGLEELVI